MYSHLFGVLICCMFVWPVTNELLFMKQLLSIVAIFVVLNTSAFSNLSPIETSKIFDHLTEVNKEWVKFNLSIFNEKISFENDLDRIQFHLLQVEKMLRNSENEHYSQEQIQNRTALLDILHNYALEKVFPINLHHSNRQPYFIDHLGTHCAVGFLLKASGFGNIAQEISETQNYAYVKEIQSKELLAWAEKNGFELNELALIQPTYPDNTTYYAIGNGANGTITKINGDENKFVIAGKFTQLDNLPCLNVGQYVNGNLSCLGVGIDGIVNEIERTGQNEITVYGKFDHLGVSYPIAIWNEVSLDWEFVAIPGKSNCEINAADSYNLDRYISIKTETGTFELLHNNGTNWYLTCSTDGPIYSIDVEYSKYVFGGKFNQAIINANTPYILNSKNVISSTNGLGWQVYPSNTPDTVFTTKIIGSNIFVGGAAINLAGHSNVLLSQLTNGTALTLIQLWSGADPLRIYDIEHHTNDMNRLVLVGNLQAIEGGFGFIMGKGAFNYSISEGVVTSAGWFNKPVHSAILTNNGDLVVSGEFTEGYETNFSHLAKSTLILGADELSSTTNLVVYPNPSTHSISIHGISIGKFFNYQITDAQGKTWRTAETSNPTINVENLSSGVYFLSIQNAQNYNSTIRFVKN
ncbi:hypothetical protein Fluta_2038 [Fluviicola taffensis DSM 16823]|uniref:Secretion system C-terminal sorting domain-containing protein n=2 Tax=Fluviicola TaxID=332102 RepID=F2IKC1_FLUTR|nr:hypothetical protein Fluta_2038 [Fluviicola taffensis DSM 16823]